MGIVIGIDPDCDKSGIAIYKDEKIIRLENLTISDYIDRIEWAEGGGVVIAIEDANMISGMYSGSNGMSVAARNQMVMRVGMIKRQCNVMIEIAENAGIEVFRYKPCKGNWESKKRKAAINCALLKDATGWDEKSNPETRSAAYFGYKHIKACKLNQS